MQAKIDYHKLLRGEHKRKRKQDPLSSYYKDRGANISSNDFADFDLNISEDLNKISILSAIIYSARNQNGFTSFKLNNFKTNFTANEIKVIEKITLSNIKIENDYILIELIDKQIFEKEIEPLKSRTKLHTNYLTPDEIDARISSIVPKIPTENEIIKILGRNKLETTVIMKDLKTIYSNFL